MSLWHTNAVVTDVPESWSDQEAQRRILALVDEGALSFVAVEGGLDCPTSWHDTEAYQPWPETADHASPVSTES